ncbi:MAG TPA: hypothetical protein VEA81_03020 [Burkholderiaceae bacterium]|nr:hypothetical protein [Burkholderiaceae bacterium]
MSSVPARAPSRPFLELVVDALLALAGPARPPGEAERAPDRYAALDVPTYQRRGIRIPEPTRAG